MMHGMHRLTMPLYLGVLLFAAPVLVRAADIPATENSLRHHVWGVYVPAGSVPDANGQFATGVFSHASDGFTLPDPVGPSFTVTRTAGSGSGHYISTRGQSVYAPGSSPVSNTGFPGLPAPANDWPMQHQLANHSVEYQFSSELPTGAIVWVLDSDISERLEMQFYTCTNDLINPANFDSYLLSQANIPTMSFSATDVVVESSVGGGNAGNPTVGVVIRSSAVCRVDLIGSNAFGGSSQDVFFSIPAPRITLD